MADPDAIRLAKVRKIFRHFDQNQDGRLSRQEMGALVVAVNPRVKFSAEQIGAILDEVFRTYSEFIIDDAGLSFEGLLRTYDDGAGDINRDFEALRLELDGNDGEDSTSKKTVPSSIVDERADSVAFAQRRQNAPAWAISSSRGIMYEHTWRLVEDLQIIIKRLEAKMAKLKEGRKDLSSSDTSSEAAWSRDLSMDGDRGGGRAWEELGPDYVSFQKALTEITQKADDDSRTPEEKFDAQMAIGRTLFDHMLYKEALSSLKKACGLKPTDPRPHFHTGNTLYSLGRCSEARDSYASALKAAEAGETEWGYLLPQIHVNLGITLEGDGMLFSASEHYKEAAVREPKHYRALKLLGSALYGVGEYRAAEKALSEAIYLKDDFADAHCDLGSTLHAMKQDERAIHEFQKALDLKPDHMDALYNLGGLFRDAGRFQRAAEMYSKVLALQPGHWRAQINKAVALLGAGETDEARKAFKEAFKMTNRVELYDAITHLKLTEKKPKGLSAVLRKANEDSDSVGSNLSVASEDNVLVVDASCFRPVDEKTTPRQWLSSALDIRRFQRHTRLNRFDVANVKKLLSEGQLPLVTSADDNTQKSITKEELEKVLHQLLNFLKPDTFQGAMKAINERILSVLDNNGTGRVNIGTFFAIIAPVCSGSLENRKRMAYDALVWQFSNGNMAQLTKNYASFFMRLLRSIYLPAQGISGMMELHGDDDQTSISYPEFVDIFDEPDWGFGIMKVVVKLEAIDRVRHSSQICSICSYPITGPWFKEVAGNFNLCSLCYSEGKVPLSFKKEEYCFKEYNSEAEVVKDKLRLFSPRS